MKFNFFQRKNQSSSEVNKDKAIASKIIGGDTLIDFLSKKLFYILFLLLLLVIRIMNSYTAEKTLSEIDDLRDSIKVLQLEAQEIESHLTKMSRPSEVLEQINKHGLSLEQSNDVPSVIYVDKDKE